MANKHERQRDFYKKMTEWKEQQNNSKVDKKEREQKEEAEKEFKLPNGISTSYTIIKTIDGWDNEER